MHFISDAFAPFLVSHGGIMSLTFTILHLTGSYDLTTIMRQRRLRWLGHVRRPSYGRWSPAQGYPLRRVLSRASFPWQTQTVL